MRTRPRFSSLPTASGGIARAAYARALEARLDLGLLVTNSGLTVRQIEDSNVRLAVRNQIKFLNSVADALNDDFLGIRLAQELDLRELGLLYYVLASSETLGDALRRVARYSTIQNEGVRISYRERDSISIAFRYVGVSRLSDRHQIEFFITTLLRVCRHITGRQVSPSSVKLIHRRSDLPTKIKELFGCEVRFGGNADEVVYPKPAKSMPVVNADRYLNNLLAKYCEETLSQRRVRPEAWRLRVENAIAPLLPHGQPETADIAQRLGVSQRTLARRLASEDVTFFEVLDAFRADLARRYLTEPGLSVSEIAWLLGYRETSAFSRAFKRWTGKSPAQARTEGAAGV
jgi:AraC-like DNA-binding protein